MKIYLTDECQSFFPIEDYILERSKRDNPEIYQRMDIEYHKVIDRVLKSKLGENWEKAIESPRVKKHIVFRKIIAPTELVTSLAEKKYGSMGYLIYSTTRLYPYFPDFHSYIYYEEMRHLSGFLMDVVDSRYKIREELEKAGVLRNDIFLLKTYGEVKRVVPNVFEWYIERLLRTHDRVEVITEEEDLTNLRRWIPEVMI